MEGHAPPLASSLLGGEFGLAPFQFGAASLSLGLQIVSHGDGEWGSTLSRSLNGIQVVVYTNCMRQRRGTG